MAIPDNKKAEVQAFFKQAFCIDGEAEVVLPSEVEELMKTHSLNVIRLTDSGPRGTFYVATLAKRV